MRRREAELLLCNSHTTARGASGRLPARAVLNGLATVRLRPCIALIILAAGLPLAAWQGEPKIAAVFDGRIHTITKKEISLDRGDENQLVLSITRKTVFERDGKEVKWNAFHRNDEVAVKGYEDFPGHLAAVKVSAKAAPADH